MGCRVPFSAFSVRGCGIGGGADLGDFLSGILAYRSIQRECRPETWLCQIAKNALYRENKRTKRTVPWERNDRATEEAGILEQLVKKEQALNIYRHIHELDDPYKEVFMLRILGELKFKEISAVYGKTESWAKVTFYRAKNKLIELMEDMD